MSAQAPLKFYWNKVCPFVQRTWITAVEKQVPVEYVYVSLAEMPDWYTKLNPKATVPAVALPSGKLLTESGPIMEYFDEQFGIKNELNQANPVTRAKMQVFMGNCGDLIGCFYQYLSDDSEANKKALTEHLNWIGGELKKQSEGPFYLGSTFSVADINIVPFLIRFKTLLKAFHDYDLDAVAPWAKAMREAALLRASVASTSPGPEYFIQVYGPTGAAYTKKEPKFWGKSTLYYSPYCPFAHRAWISYAKKDLGNVVELKEVPLPAPEWFKEINPAETVPAVVTAQGELVQESNVIVNYLDEAFPDSGVGIVPKDADQNALSKEFIKDVGGFFSGFFKFIKAEPKSKEKEEKFAELNGDADWIEGLIKNASDGKGPWFLGETFSNADVVILPVLVRLDAVFNGTDKTFSDDFDFWAKHPTLSALLKAGRADAAIAATFLKHEDYLGAFKKMLGRN